jgi:hypothetical protein
MKKRRNLTRRTYGTNPAWLVRISRKGKRYSKLFYDHAYGGSRKAELAAREYRDKLLARLPADPWRSGPQVRRRSNNSSGVAGVYRTLQSVVRLCVQDGEWYEYTQPYWVAAWTETDGTRHSKKFSVKKYGEGKAKRLAREYRWEMVQQLRQEAGGE